MGIKTKSRGTIFNVRIKDQKTPQVEKVEKVDGDYVVTETGDAFEGTLVNAEVSDYTYKGDKKYKLTLLFEDEDSGKEYLSMNFNYLTLGIINTLANEDSLFGRVVSFSFYEKDENAKCYMTIEGTEKCNWKFSGEDFTKISKAGEETWVRLFKEHVKPKFEGAAVMNAEVKSDDSFPIADSSPTDDGFDFDDLPF